MDATSVTVGSVVINVVVVSVVINVVVGAITPGSSESSTNSESKHFPPLVSGVPIARLIASTSTARPAFVGWTRSLFKTPLVVEISSQLSNVTDLLSAATDRISAFTSFCISRNALVVTKSVGRGARDLTIAIKSVRKSEIRPPTFVPKNITAASHPS